MPAGSPKIDPNNPPKTNINPEILYFKDIFNPCTLNEETLIPISKDNA